MSRHRLINGKSRHLHGWRKDRPDHRDLKYTIEAPEAAMPRGPISPHSDLRQFCSPINDQGELGSCTANSSTEGMEFLYRKLGKPVVMLSRLFDYYATRVWVEQTSPSDDSGAQIRDVMKALAKYGVCLETTWPYEVAMFSTEPPANAKAEALNHQILKYYKATTLDSIRMCLSGGYPLVGGFSVPENMESDECAKTGIINFPSPTEQIVGGHAVLFVGHDDSKKLLMFQNSWGEGWGDKGFGYLPYQFVTEQMADDFWTIRTEEM